MCDTTWAYVQSLPTIESVHTVYHLFFFSLELIIQGNKYVNEQRHLDAVTSYTRAISLDSKKTVYYSNRAVALNTLGSHHLAEADCRHILSKDAKNGKAFFQRALARSGMGRWREAEGDLKEVLRFQAGNESARKLMAVVKAEIGKLPKLKVEDVMDF
jgi:tetratricopeptide (TPR) repeat protein